MYELLSELIVYRSIGEHPIMRRLSSLYRALSKKERYGTSLSAGHDLCSEGCAIIHMLLDLATECGFDRNLWQDFIAYLIAMTETPYTLVSERAKKVDGSVNSFVTDDIKILMKLFLWDFSHLDKSLGTDHFSTITSYKAVQKEDRIYNKNVSVRVRELSDKILKAIESKKSAQKKCDAMLSVITDFYGRYGVGIFGMNQAFRINGEQNGAIVPVTIRGNESLDDLIGYEQQKKLLSENTERFLNGRPANNVLLYGDAGTGKSTSVKAILNRYYDDGLRMIEVYRHDFKYLNHVIEAVQNRNYRFIIFMDDLSFEESESDYKYLKAVIEGGLYPAPENVLIYATSNRRHLVKETWTDRSDRSSDELHRSDTVSEKLSLSDRFGLKIGYFKPSEQEYFEIVKGISKRVKDLNMTDEKLLSLAREWEMGGGGLSGRSAEQFIRMIEGKKEF